MVHPILTEQDRVIILRKCLYAEPLSTVHIKDIVEIASKYIPEEMLNDFRDDLNKYYATNKIKKVSIKSNEINLLDCLTDSVVLYTAADDKELTVLKNFGNLSIL